MLRTVVLGRWSTASDISLAPRRPAPFMHDQRVSSDERIHVQVFHYARRFRLKSNTAFEDRMSTIQPATWKILRNSRKWQENVRSGMINLVGCGVAHLNRSHRDDLLVRSPLRMRSRAQTAKAKTGRTWYRGHVCTGKSRPVERLPPASRQGSLHKSKSAVPA